MSVCSVLIMGVIRFLIPSGTCVLLEVPSVQSLVHYVQTIHSLSDNYELIGGQISTYETAAVNRVNWTKNNSILSS